MDESKGSADKTKGRGMLVPAESTIEERETVRELARALREDRAIADFSEHILAVARA